MEKLKNDNKYVSEDYDLGYKDGIISCLDQLISCFKKDINSEENKGGMIEPQMLLETLAGIKYVFEKSIEKGDKK